MFRFGWPSLERAARHHRCLLCDALFLAATIAGAMLIVCTFDVFPSALVLPGHEQLARTQQALALAVVFCGGLLTLAWRVFLAQQREVARRIDIEQVARERALRDLLTGLPYGATTNRRV